MQSPGEHLRAEIGRLGLDQAKLGAAIGVSRQSINNIINGRQQVSRAMAKKLGALTGCADDYWLRNSFKPRMEIAEPPQPVAQPPCKRKPKRITEPFHAFVRKLPDAPEDDLVKEIKAAPELAAVATWAQLRFHFVQQRADDKKLVAARALWKKYVGSV